MQAGGRRVGPAIVDHFCAAQELPADTKRSMLGESVMIKIADTVTVAVTMPDNVPLAAKGKIAGTQRPVAGQIDKGKK